MKSTIAHLFKYLFKIPFLNKFFYSTYIYIFKPLHLFDGVVIVSNYKGLKINLHLDDWIQQNIFFVGDYEKAELQTLNKFLKSDSVFIDIGANFGLFSLCASKLIRDDGKIISFEPFPQNYQSLVQNVKLNNLTQIVTVNAAIGQEVGKLTMYYDEKEQNLGMASARPLDNGTVVEVDIFTLDSYLELNPVDKIDYIKIDVEGFELAVLNGMKNSLEKFKPNLLIEIFDQEINEQHVEIHDLLYSIGYLKHFIDDDGKLRDVSTNKVRKNYLFSTQNLY